MVYINSSDIIQVTISNFDKRLQIEQIRYIETEAPLACSDEQKLLELSLHNDFEDHLWQRTQCLVKQHDLASTMARAARLSRYAKTFALLVAALLGTLGIMYAVTDSHTINIYWLLLVLLGFNFISMLLWLTGISLNMEGLTAGILARLTSWLPGYLDNKIVASEQTNNQTNPSASKNADKAWLECNFRGAVGKWQFSKITHQLWLTYLFAGLVFLVLLLMVRQYDFVWGTTLLSDTAFVKLTEALSAPLQALGFATPSADQVQETRIGILPTVLQHTDLAQTLSIEHRTRWAQFLLGALLCFGIVPRLLLWFWSALMCRYARRNFALDYYLPYYISLRQKLMPLASHGQIIDADTVQPVISNKPERPTSAPASLLPHVLPAECQWVAVEPGDNTPWPPESIRPDNDLGKVIDRESLSRILQQIQLNNYPDIAVAVSSARTPDRGVQRTITSLLSSSKNSWLVLLQDQEQLDVSATRLEAWYRLAEACKIPADHVISMSAI